MDRREKERGKTGRERELELVRVSCHLFRVECSSERVRGRTKGRKGGREREARTKGRKDERTKGRKDERTKGRKEINQA